MTPASRSIATERSIAESRLAQADRAAGQARAEALARSEALAQARRETEILVPLVEKGVEPTMTLVRAKSAEREKLSGELARLEERKAAMVSNLLVVLCGNHDAQPVVNSGSLY